MEPDDLDKRCVVLFRYTEAMRWAVAATYQSGRSASKGIERYRVLMRADTQFMIAAA